MVLDPQAESAKDRHWRQAMGLLDDILGQAGGGAPRGGAGAASGLGAIADLVMKNPQIVAAVVSMLNPRDTSVGGGGGLADVIGSLTRAGLGSAASSWVSGGPNLPVDPGQLASALGPDILGQFAQKAGIPHADAGSVLAQVLPHVVNHATPQGQVPDAASLDNVLGSLLGSLGGR
jgi:uncharacterized protein YidB (DUF937 family)